MRDSVSLVVVRNPFDRSNRDERLLHPVEMPTVADMVRDNLPLSAEVSVAIDGELITREEWAARTLRPGEQMVVMPVVHGGDNGILGMVLMVAVMVVAPEIAASMYSAMGGTFVSANAGLALAGLTMGVQMVGSMIIGGLMAPSKPNLPANSLQSYDNSPAYSWQPATTQQPGGAVARAYGRHKLYGNIIAGYIENQGSTGQQQIAHLLIDLGTGPYSSLYDFQINDQPVGYYNGVTVTARMGNINQVIIPAFNDTLTTHSINAKVVKGSPITRDTVGINYDALEIVLTCPQGLWYANDSGGLDEVRVNFAVEISADGGITWNYVAVEAGTLGAAASGYWSLGYMSSDIVPVWVEVAKGSSIYTDHIEGQRGSSGWINRWTWMAIPANIATTVKGSITLSGATRQPVRRTLRVNNLARGTRYKVRATNLSDDQTGSRYGDDVYLAEINEVMYDDFQYPRTVLVGVDALANDQISGSLKFSCIADAAIVRVWNGASWSSAWSNNPAWVCWDILTQPVLDNSLSVVRYDGLDPSRLVLATFKAWADFCDVMVADGKGGTEKRCTFDGVFDTPTTMWDAALEVCASARAQLVMRGTSVSVVVDDIRSTPAQLFNVGNTAVSSFSETWLKMEGRAASIEVDYIDAAQGYTRSLLTVVNTAIAESTAQRTQIGLRGVTRTSQIWREANLKLKRNEMLKRSSGIGVDIDALACTVGDLILLQSDVTRWGVGGRAASGSTTTHLMLDQSITLDSGKTYELKLHLSDDTLVTRTITTAAGTVSAVDVSVAFPSAPALYDVWAIGETGKAAKEFIVLDVARDGEQRAKLGLIEYNATLYGLDSGIPALPTPNISASAAPTLTSLVVEELMERAADGAILVHIDLHFTLQDAEKAVFYEGGTFIGESVTGVFRRNNVTSGSTYTIKCAPISAVGASPLSRWKAVTYTVVGKLARPADVTGFTLTATSTGIQAKWNAIADVDRSEYEIVPSGGTFGAASPTYRGKALGKDLGLLPAGTYTFWIKAIDTTGNYSLNYTAASITVTAPAVVNPAAAIVGADIVLTWAPPASMFAVDYIDVRYGADFATGMPVGKVSATSITRKVDYVGGRTYWVAAVDVAGNVGATSTASVNITAPSQPYMTGQSIENHVLLYWTDATRTLPVDYYLVRKGATWAGGASIGTKQGLFTSLMESVAGLNTYWVAGVDSAGNVGTPASVALNVSAPSDYMLKLDRDSTFSGTLTNARLEQGALIAPVNTSETFAQHFTNHAWNTPQDQINAGYPLYIEPANATGSYVETLDYGAVVAATLISVIASTTVLRGAVTVTPTISVSLDNINWTNYAGVWQQYASNFRYVKITLNFSQSGGDNLIRVDAINFKLSLHYINDAGNGTANSGDSGGTVVNFKIPFISVESITVTPKGTTPAIGLYDFAGGANPTSFKVLLFNQAGTRISGDFSWSAKGV